MVEYLALLLYTSAMNKRKTSAPKRRQRLSRADLQACEALDTILAWERDMEQRYHLPFRMPHKTLTSLQQCTHCGKDIAFLIFGDNTSDAAGLEAYARLMDDPIRRTNLPTYILGAASDTGPIDEQPSLLLKVWPVQEEPRVITPPEWDRLIEQLSELHCPAHKS